MSASTPRTSKRLLTQVDPRICINEKYVPLPWNLTWNLKRSPWKRRFLLETIIFRFHVKFRGSKLNMMVGRLLSFLKWSLFKGTCKFFGGGYFIFPRDLVCVMFQSQLHCWESIITVSYGGPDIGTDFIKLIHSFKHHPSLSKCMMAK